jgi:prepilin-type processing-associated H-X9-DG protein
MTMYAQQYTHSPVAWVNLTGNRTAQCWPVRLRKFLDGNQQVFYCPAQDPRCQWTPDMPGDRVFPGPVLQHCGYEPGERVLIGSDVDAGVTKSAMFFSYGINSLGSTPSFPPRRGLGGTTYNASGPIQSDARKLKAKSSSEFIVITDTVADGVGDFQTFPRNLVAGTGWDNSPGAIHRGGSNVLFFDGHVRWYLKSELVVRWPLVRGDADKQRMWNIDHQPARRW